jgi:hypothetical protein
MMAIQKKKIISLEKNSTYYEEFTYMWGTRISLTKQHGLSVPNLNMIVKNHHVTEENANQY